jgi:hypothetical protein
MMRRVFLFVILLVAVLAVPEYTANPGGEGDGTEEFVCGGACHGDPGLSSESSALLTITSDRSETYVGGPLSVTVSAQDMQLSERKLAGLFLLTGTHGVGDTPQADGWTILSDGAGGSGNYVEQRVTSLDGSTSVTWALRAPLVEGDYRLITAIHHGGDASARMAVDEVGVLITVGPVPENLPQISAEWAPPTKTLVGEEMVLSVPASNSTSVSLEWTSRGAEGSVVMTQQGDAWVGSLPIALSATEIQYRVVMTNEIFVESSAWITLSVEQQDILPNAWAFRFQSIAIMFVSLAFCITLNRRFGRPAKAGISGMKSTFNQPSTIPMAPVQQVVQGIDMSDPRRPLTWSDEQWLHYGEDYLKGLEGGV